MEQKILKMLQRRPMQYREIERKLGRSAGPTGGASHVPRKMQSRITQSIVNLRKAGRVIEEGGRYRAAVAEELTVPESLGNLACSIITHLFYGACSSAEMEQAFSENMGLWRTLTYLSSHNLVARENGIFSITLSGVFAMAKNDLFSDNESKILMVLRFSPHNVKTLARAINSAEENVLNAVTSLIRNGLVERRNDQYVLTEQGHVCCTHGEKQNEQPSVPVEEGYVEKHPYEDVDQSLPEAELNYVENEDEEDETPPTTDELIQECLSNLDYPLSVEELGERFSLSTTTVRKYLHVLEAAGKVSFCGTYAVQASLDFMFDPRNRAAEVVLSVGKNAKYTYPEFLERASDDSSRWAMRRTIDALVEDKRLIRKGSYYQIIVPESTRELRPPVDHEIQMDPIEEKIMEPVAEPSVQVIPEVFIEVGYRLQDLAMLVRANPDYVRQELRRLHTAINQATKTNQK